MRRAIDGLTLLYVLMLNGFIVACCKAELRKLDTPLGTLIGYRANFGWDRWKLYYGEADVFLGVPYAKPPVGDLRFKRPVALDRFTADGRPYDATYQHPMCPQLSSTPNATMSEDCL
ncbi:unnamed protein product, partial [Anisakis simplex]|uniref:COesterase domain-containing protein n=1 Tax=Anisakis simplex TaxID=6269 RepID=A0A0M3JAM5_ANISI